MWGERRPAWRKTYLVQASAGIDRAALDGGIGDGRQRDQKVAAADLGVEEDLGAKEALVANVAHERLLRHGLLVLVLLEPLGRLGVVLLELLDNVGAHVAVRLLDALGDLQRLRRRDRGLALTHQLLHEGRNVLTGDRNVLDATADDVTLSLFDENNTHAFESPPP